jgi:hypothetical protein
MYPKQEANVAMTSIDATKTFPAVACQREPLRKEIAAAPANIAKTPALT